MENELCSVYLIASRVISSKLLTPWGAKSSPFQHFLKFLASTHQIAYLSLKKLKLFFVKRITLPLWSATSPYPHPNLDLFLCVKRRTSTQSRSFCVIRKGRTIYRITRGEEKCGNESLIAAEPLGNYIIITTTKETSFTWREHKILRTWFGILNT